MPDLTFNLISPVIILTSKSRFPSFSSILYSNFVLSSPIVFNVNFFSFIIFTFNTFGVVKSPSLCVIISPPSFISIFSPTAKT